VDRTLQSGGVADTKLYLDSKKLITNELSMDIKFLSHLGCGAVKIKSYGKGTQSQRHVIGYTNQLSTKYLRTDGISTSNAFSILLSFLLAQDANED
jgi:hypothetical protein